MMNLSLWNLEGISLDFYLLYSYPKTNNSQWRYVVQGHRLSIVFIGIANNILMERLLKFGHQKIALLNVHKSFNYGHQRKVAYEDFHKKHKGPTPKNVFKIT